MFKYFVTNVLFSTNVNHNIEIMTHRYKFYRLIVRDETLFTRESSYCFQRILAIAILSVRPSVRPSVCLSVTRVDQSKRCKLGSPNHHLRLSGRL